MSTLIELFEEKARGCIEGQRNTLSCYAPKRRRDHPGGTLQLLAASS